MGNIGTFCLLFTLCAIILLMDESDGLRRGGFRSSPRSRLGRRGTVRQGSPSHLGRRSDLAARARTNSQVGAGGTRASRLDRARNRRARRQERHDRLDSRPDIDSSGLGTKTLIGSVLLQGVIQASIVPLEGWVSRQNMERGHQLNSELETQRMEFESAMRRLEQERASNASIIAADLAYNRSLQAERRAAKSEALQTEYVELIARETDERRIADTMDDIEMAAATSLHSSREQFRALTPDMRRVLPELTRNMSDTVDRYVQYYQNCQRASLEAHRKLNITTTRLAQIRKSLSVTTNTNTPAPLRRESLIPVTDSSNVTTLPPDATTNRPHTDNRRRRRRDTHGVSDALKRAQLLRERAWHEQYLHERQVAIARASAIDELVIPMIDKVSDSSDVTTHPTDDQKTTHKVAAQSTTELDRYDTAVTTIDFLFSMFFSDYNLIKGKERTDEINQFAAMTGTPCYGDSITDEIAPWLQLQQETVAISGSENTPWYDFLFSFFGISSRPVEKEPETFVEKSPEEISVTNKIFNQSQFTVKVLDKEHTVKAASAVDLAVALVDWIFAFRSDEMTGTPHHTMTESEEILEYENYYETENELYETYLDTERQQYEQYISIVETNECLVSHNYEDVKKADKEFDEPPSIDTFLPYKSDITLDYKSLHSVKNIYLTEEGRPDYGFAVTDVIPYNYSRAGKKAIFQAFRKWLCPEIPKDMPFLNTDYDDGTSVPIEEAVLYDEMVWLFSDILTNRSGIQMRKPTLAEALPVINHFGYLLCDIQTTIEWDMNERLMLFTQVVPLIFLDARVITGLQPRAFFPTLVMNTNNSILADLKGTVTIPKVTRYVGQFGRFKLYRRGVFTMIM